MIGEWVFPVVVAALLLTAGCLDGSGGATPGTDTNATTPGSRTPTEAVVQTESATATRTEISTPGPFEYPPGITEDAVDVSRFMATFNESLGGRNFTVRWVQRSAERATTNVVKVGAGGDRWLKRYDGPHESNAVYVNNHTMHVKQVEDGRIDYSAVPVASPPSPRRAHRAFQLVEGQLTAANYAPAGTTVRNGTRYLVLTADSYQAPGDSDANVTEFSGRMLVDEQGFVRLVSTEVTVERDGETSTYSLRFDLTAVGETTPSEPDWLDWTNRDDGDDRTDDGKPLDTVRATAPELGAKVAVTYENPGDVDADVVIVNASDRISSRGDVRNVTVSSFVAIELRGIDPSAVTNVKLRLAYDDSGLQSDDEKGLKAVVYGDGPYDTVRPLVNPWEDTVTFERNRFSGNAVFFVAVLERPDPDHDDAAERESE